MRKKLIAFLTALTICAGMSAVIVSAEMTETEEAESISESETVLESSAEESTSGDEQAETKSVKKKSNVNPNISAEYADTKKVPLFDDSKVHTINIIADEDDWEGMIDVAEDKEYINCDIEIDGELLKNVAIRPKGNASLRAVAKMNDEYNTHFSFKVELDHNDNKTTYHGLDKLALNNLGQDISCQKDFLAYHMMNDMGVKAPLSSYTVLQLNGEDFGLYLAVEAIEDSFAVRNYGSAEEVNLYKPEVLDEIPFSKISTLRSLMQIMSGLQYKDKTADDRVEVFNDYWGTVFDYYTVPYMQWTGSEEDYELFFQKNVLEGTENNKQIFMDSLNKLNNGADVSEKLSVLNTDQLMRYFVVHSFVCNNDSITGVFAQNFYLAEKDGIFSYVPWDYNLSFGGLEFETEIQHALGDIILDMTPERLNNYMSVNKSVVNYPIDEPVMHGETADIPMLGTWLNEETDKAEYHKLYDEFIKKFENGNYEKLSDSVHDMIQPYVKQGLTFYQTEDFEKASEQAKLFMKYRSESVRGQLDGSIPATKDGQSRRAETLIDPENLDISLMRDDSSTVTDVPPAPYLNQMITAFLGNDPDNSIGHFADLILGYWQNPQTMYDRVPELMQVPALRNGARNMIVSKYNSFSLFSVKGAEIQANQKPAETDTEDETAETESEQESGTAEETASETEETKKEGEE